MFHWNWLKSRTPSGPLEEPSKSSLEDSLICYSANATASRGGQGEFLRQMVYALHRVPRGLVLSRGAHDDRVNCVDIPFEGWRASCFRAIQNTPYLRRRQDLLTLLNDADFDSHLQPHVKGAALFHGVMAQCCETLEHLSRGHVPLILTTLNTHIDNVAEVLQAERRRLSIQTPSFIHPAMRRRALREIERADCIHAVSRLSKQSFIERGIKPEKIQVVNPAVDLDYFRPAKRSDAIFRVLAVMTIDFRKGAYYLLQAFEKAAIANSELVIIGATGDPWSKSMLAKFTSRISNLRIQQADVFQQSIAHTYGQASVLVHPALEDGFALVVAQALACGVPVITTRQTGASELVANGKNGFVLESRDVDGLVDRLRLLARDESLLKRFSSAAPEAVAHLGYPEFARNVARLYSRVLAA